MALSSTPVVAVAAAAAAVTAANAITTKLQTTCIRLNNSLHIPKIGMALSGPVQNYEQVLHHVASLPTNSSQPPPFVNILCDAHTTNTETYLGNILPSRIASSESLIQLGTHLQPCKASQVAQQINAICKRLNLTRLDHVSMPSPFLMPGVIGPRGEFREVEYLSVWRELEILVRAGQCRSIGVTDMSTKKLKQFLPLCDIVPSISQVEMHPFMSQDDALEYSKTNRLTIAALAPLASYPSADGLVKSADNTTLHRIAADLKCTVPQAMIKWGMNRETVCLPRTLTLDQLKDNMDAAYSTTGITNRHGRMFSGLNRHQRLHRAESAATSLDLDWHRLWDELALDANGIPLFGSALCAVDALSNDSAMGIGYPGALHSPMFLVKHNGKITAYLNRCPHLNTALDSNGNFLDKTGKHIVCTTHGALFTPSSGHCTSGPCVGDYLVTIPTHIRGGHVIMGAEPQIQ